MLKRIVIIFIAIAAAFAVADVTTFMAVALFANTNHPNATSPKTTPKPQPTPTPTPLSPPTPSPSNHTNTNATISPADCKKLERPFIDNATGTNKVIGITMPSCEGTMPGMGNIIMPPVPHSIPTSNVNGSYFFNPTARQLDGEVTDGNNATTTTTTTTAIMNSTAPAAATAAGTPCPDGTYADVNATCPPSR